MSELLFLFEGSARRARPHRPVRAVSRSLIAIQSEGSALAGRFDASADRYADEIRLVSDNWPEGARKSVHQNRPYAVKSPES